MSRYAGLKQTIDDNIRQNEDGEITGSILNTVLNEMTTALGKGYQYMGLAVPATNPGTPDQQLYYMAVEPGTYTNFGSFVLEAGKIGMFVYDTIWHGTAISVGADIAEYLKSATVSADGKTLTLTKKDGTTVTFTPGGSSVEIVNDLTTGGADKALSAEQGKLLKQMINGTVRYDEPQTLTDAQKQQAQKNLGLLGNKNLNKARMVTVKTGTPWTGFVSCKYMAIPISYIGDKVYELGSQSIAQLRFILNDDSVASATVTKKRFFTAPNTVIMNVWTVPANAKEVRIAFYPSASWTQEAIDNLFIGGSIDIHYDNWAYLRNGINKPEEEWYADESKYIADIKARYDAGKQLHLYDGISLSKKNLMRIYESADAEATASSPYFPAVTSGYMPINPNSEYYYSVNGQTPVALGLQGIDWYDSDKVYISSSSHAYGTSPANAAYARVKLSNYAGVFGSGTIWDMLEGKAKVQFEESSAVTGYEPIYQFANHNADKLSYLAGKRFISLGDSFSAPGSWQTRMANDTGMINAGNYAVSGGRWSCVTSGYGAYERAQTIPAGFAEPDYIFMFLGVNDSNNEITLGSIVYANSISAFDTDTFTGGAQAVINYLMNRFPHSVIKIGWTPAGQSYTMIKKNEGQYITRLQELALIYGCQYVETRYCGITPYVDADSDFFESGTSGGHPTTSGQQAIGNAMARIILSNM